MQGFNLHKYRSVWKHKHDVKIEAAQLRGFSVNFSCVWWETPVLVNLQCELDLHQQPWKPQRRKSQNGLSGVLEGTISNYISQCFRFHRFHDLCSVYTFVWTHRVFFPSPMTIIQSLFPSSLQLPSFRHYIRKHCLWNPSSVCPYIKLKLNQIL